MTKATINRAIRGLGIEIQNKRGDGYSYFTSLATGYQVGDSVPVCYMNHLTLDQWIERAAYEVARQAKEDSFRVS